MKATAVDRGDHWLLNGSKTYISNGQLADLIIVAARTVPEQRYGIGLLVVEADMAGFKRGNRLQKMGLRAQDTSELFFDNDTLNCSGCGCLGKNADHTLRQKRCGAGGGHALLSTSPLIVPRRDASRSVNP